MDHMLLEKICSYKFHSGKEQPIALMPNGDMVPYQSTVKYLEVHFDWNSLLLRIGRPLLKISSCTHYVVVVGNISSSPPIYWL